MVSSGCQGQRRVGEKTRRKIAWAAHPGWTRYRKPGPPPGSRLDLSRDFGASWGFHLLYGSTKEARVLIRHSLHLALSF